MKDPRCMVGLHNYVEPPRGRPRPPVVPGRIGVECSRCHKEKSMRVPGAVPSGPVIRHDGGYHPY